MTELAPPRHKDINTDLGQIQIHRAPPALTTAAPRAVMATAPRRPGRSPFSWPIWPARPRAMFTNCTASPRWVPQKDNDGQRQMNLTRGLRNGRRITATTILDARGNPIKPDKPALSEDIALAHHHQRAQPALQQRGQHHHPSAWAACCARWLMAATPGLHDPGRRIERAGSALRIRACAPASWPWQRCRPVSRPLVRDASDKKLADEVRMLMETTRSPELFFDLLSMAWSRGSRVYRSCGIPPSPPGPKDYKWVDPLICGRMPRPQSEIP